MMTLKPREKQFIKVGIIVVGVFFLYILLINPLRVKWVDARDAHHRTALSFTQLREQVVSKVKLDRSISALQKSIDVTIPKSPSSEQIQEFVREVENLGGKNKISINRFIPKDESVRRGRGTAKAGSKVSFSINFEANHESLVHFIEGLQKIGKPVVFESIDMKSELTKPDQIRVIMEFYTYLFEGIAQ